MVPYLLWCCLPFVSLRNVNRYLIPLLAAAFLSCNAVAAGTHKAHAAKAAVVSEVTKDGEPNIQSSGVLVLDATTGQTLYSKNADHTAPIASSRS